MKKGVVIPMSERKRDRLIHQVFMYLINHAEVAWFKWAHDDETVVRRVI